MRQGKIGVALDRSRQVFSRAAEGFVPVGVAFAKPGHECFEPFWIAACSGRGISAPPSSTVFAAIPVRDARFRPGPQKPAP